MHFAGFVVHHQWRSATTAYWRPTINHCHH